MDKSTLVEALITLNSLCREDTPKLDNPHRRGVEEALKILQCSYPAVLETVTPLIGTVDCHPDSDEWRCICLYFYILESLDTELSKSDMEVLSVQQTKDVKGALETLMTHGILKGIQPGLPHGVKCRHPPHCERYMWDLQKATCLGVYNCIKRPNLRMLLVPHWLPGLLVAVLQFAYAPLRKPGDKSKETFVMTEDIYLKARQDQILFGGILEEMSRTIHPSIFIKEIMLLSRGKTPVWFRKAISKTLTTMLRAEKGVQHLSVTMLNGLNDDTAESWHVVDVLTNIIFGCRSMPDFETNILVQVLDLLPSVKATELSIFERLVASCTKRLYAEDESLCDRMFINRITLVLKKLAYKEYAFHDSDDITDDVKQTVRLLHACFLHNTVTSPCLPMCLLDSHVCLMFHLYHLTVKSTLRATNKELKEILGQCLRRCTRERLHQLLDCFLFNFTVPGVPLFRDDLIVQVDDRILVSNSQHRVSYATADGIDTVYNLLDAEQKLLLFGYLLECITHKDKYFLPSSSDLLGGEDHATNSVMERLLTIHKLLSQLSENKHVQDLLRTKPGDIIEYIKNVLTCSTTDSQLAFVVVMIVDNIVSSGGQDVVDKYRVLSETLTKVAAETSETELRNLCNRVMVAFGRKFPKTEVEETELDRALEDVRHPLLPTRGHGLLVLAKLIEKKDRQAMERKQYMLNLFQLYLKDEDSFIYLNAIRGLAALADVFSDTVLEVLCEEYADFSKKGESAQETRMKLGEALVRVVKLLGDMAPKYKSLLLNTFLSGTKDDDHLLRASSLSNLGEVCRVLNYKLGTIVTEVLVCVHAIITTDKAAEARRAAVTVIRQLFVGLQSEMLAFLKEEILPIYRTLKEVYHNDRDDVVRLQAQLALEELDENMKSFLFPKPELHFEKKIVMLN